MSDLKNWAVVDSANLFPSPDGWPEGMARSGVNNSGRAVMGGVRRVYEDPEYHDLTAADYTITKLSANSFNAVHDTTPTDATSKFPVGSRVRMSVSGGSITSGIVQTSEGRLTLMLTKEGKQVRRVEVELAPGGVHELNP